MFGKQKKEEPKEFKEEDYKENEEVEEIPKPKKRDMQIVKKEEVKEEATKEEGKLTEQEIFALGMWHLNRGYSLLKLLG
jgi:hypothetical protein